MRIWHVHQFGEPGQMQFAEVAVPVPKAAEVRVRVHAAGVNFFDLLLVQGKYQAKPVFPFTPGAEAAGVIDALGVGVTGLATGDRVIALPQFNCFAEYLIAPAGKVLPVPPDMDFDRAAAMPIVYQTSWFGLVDRARLQPGEWLLVHAGASGVGMAAIQIGKALGARVVATAGSDAKVAFCLEQGAEQAWNYSTDDWVEQVKRITGRGADVVYDPVGGDIFDLSTKCLAPGGRLLVVGFTSGRIPTIAANRLLLKNISVVGAIWGNWCAEHPGYIHQAHRHLRDLWDKKEIDPKVYRRYDLEDAPQALRDLGNRKAMGKVVLHVL